MKIVKSFKKLIKNKSKKILNNIYFCIIGVLGALILRILRPIILIRIGSLVGSRIGHFALNTELYICEKNNKINTPKEKYVDLFYLDPENNRPICNKSLLAIWRRVLKIYPAYLLYPIDKINRNYLKSRSYEVNSPAQSDRDIYGLIDKTPFPHLEFTRNEEKHGSLVLREMGVLADKKFICLIARDSAYLPEHLGGNYTDYEYHNYRDVNIDDYLLAPNKIAEMGYYVIRMGAKVQKNITSSHPNVIDYAVSKFRSDFMDIYLGAKCFFCISNGVGFDAVPYIYRRPIVYTNMVPFNYFCTFGRQNIGIFKHHICKISDTKLSMKCLNDRGVFSATTSKSYSEKNILLMDNSPEEIFEVCEEMIIKINGGKEEKGEGEGEEMALQTKFSEEFIAISLENKYRQLPLHGEFLAKIGKKFLLQNKHLLSL